MQSQFERAKRANTLGGDTLRSCRPPNLNPSRVAAVRVSIVSSAGTSAPACHNEQRANASPLGASAGDDRLPDGANLLSLSRAQSYSTRAMSNFTTWKRRVEPRFRPNFLQLFDIRGRFGPLRPTRRRKIYPGGGDWSGRS